MALWITLSCFFAGAFIIALVNINGLDKENQQLKTKVEDYKGFIGQLLDIDIPEDCDVKVNVGGTN